MGINFSSCRQHWSFYLKYDIQLVCTVFQQLSSRLRRIRSYPDISDLVTKLMAHCSRIHLLMRHIAQHKKHNRTEKLSIRSGLM